jgi:hypothetical protein
MQGVDNFHKFFDYLVERFSCGRNTWTGRILGTVALNLLVLLGLFAFQAFMYGCRESCYQNIGDADESWRSNCAWKTYWLSFVLAVLITVALPFWVYIAFPEPFQPCDPYFQSGFFCVIVPFWFFSFASFFFLCQTVVGYPAVIMADIAHWEIDDMPLSEVAGTDANGIFLTGNESVRVAAEYANTAYGECADLQSGEYPVCLKYQYVCVAPIIRTQDFNLSRAVWEETVKTGFEDHDHDLYYASEKTFGEWVERFGQTHIKPEKHGVWTVPPNGSAVI